MCRIAGIYDPRQADLSAAITVMRDSMAHGGPDDAGNFIHPSLPLALGHRRLALIDLSPGGHQPMHFAEAGLHIVFNGEIYNYRELRRTLEHYGFRFNTQSDTEVILKAYAHWGLDAFEFLNGMFALCIWDEHRQELILARDHAGIKPLYYQLSRDALYFASEIKAFSHAVLPVDENPQWRMAFLSFGHLPEPVTTLHNVVPLEKGHALIVELPSLRTRKHCFFRWHFTNAIRVEEEALSLMRDTLEEAVQRHLLSDAPIGLFLSGGIDSSLLTLLAKKYHTGTLHTLSIVFQEKQFSEAQYQEQIVALTGAAHQSFLITEADFTEHLEDALRAMDQPTLDGINTYFISRYARQSGLKAVLSGLGADELFGGYPSFHLQQKLAYLRKMPAPVLNSLQYLPDQRLRKLSFAGQTHTAAEYLTLRGIFTPSAVARLLGCYRKEVVSFLEQLSCHYAAGELKGKNRISWLETNFYMQNQLLKDSDFMSMWHGLEIRVPFLDKEVMNMAAAVHPDIKYRTDYPKYLLVKAFKNELPEAIWKRRKQGFTFPFERWLRKSIFSQPANATEEGVYKDFLNGRLSWGRYWCALLMSRFHSAFAHA